jgi:hypothetical protein
VRTSDLETTNFVHVVVRSERCVVPLVSPVVAPWLWTRLRRAFALAIAATLMTDHIHVVTPERDESEARRKLGAITSALSRSKNPAAANTWQPAATKDVTADPQKVARHVRYVALNPPRRGLAKCPLEWVWTTHRDVMGAVTDPWVSPERVAAALRRPMDGFRAWLHDYVSGDSSTRPDGTPLPRVHDGHGALYSRLEALEAASACVRGDLTAVSRKGPSREQFLALAKRAGWAPKSLAAACGVSAQTVRRYFREPVEVAPATLACLGDPRLRSYLRR